MSSPTESQHKVEEDATEATSASTDVSASASASTCAIAPPALEDATTTTSKRRCDGGASGANFFTKLEARIKEIDSHLCVGLDPHSSELGLVDRDVDESDHDHDHDHNAVDGGCRSEKEREVAACDAAYTFCKTLIDETVPYAAAYKPNAAFFEALGPNLGLSTLRRVVDAIPDGIPVLLDVKRGDIGSTASAYADACYEGLHADAVTLSPLMGWDSVEPFVTGKYSDRGAFVLCKTSNPGSADLLALELTDGQKKTAVFEKIAHLAREWSNRAAASSPSSFDSGPSSSSSSLPPSLSPILGLVVGATDPVALSAARKAAGDGVWILAPGVGAQGGNLVDACRSGMNAHGTRMLVPVSRGISRASDIASEARKVRDAINEARKEALMEAATAMDKADHEMSTAAAAAVEVAPYQRDFLEFSLAEGVLKFGSFVLKSGRTSPYFFNAGLFSTGAALHRLGEAYAAAIMASSELTADGRPTFDVVFGPAYKGISLGALVCAALYRDHGIDVGYAYNRKEAKDHGEGGTLVGASMEGGKRVLVVDDVITAGTAIRESHSALSSIGAVPVGVVIALDRAEKRSLDDPVSAVQAVARDLEIPVVSIVSLPQLQAFLEKSPDYGDDVLSSVKEYRAQYGV